MSIPGAGLDKTGWRRRILDQRAALPAAVRAAEAQALARAAAEIPLTGPVFAYVPVGTEPGGDALLPAVAATGAAVFLPVTAAAGPLCWGTYHSLDSLVPGRFGLREPAAALPPEAIGQAAVVLVPALAVDRRGVRLGRGAGHYDRSLLLADPRARLVAVVRDSELVAELPAEPHDYRVGWALTPGQGLVSLAQR